MKTLESCYEISFSKINFLERKLKINHPKTILYGARYIGKSYLIYDYLSLFKSEEYLYIDFNDIRNNFDDIKENLDTFLRKNPIKVLVLENFSFAFEIPYCDNIIISTNIEKKIKGFKNIFLNPLDFEEYLLHEQKNQNITASFNNYLKYGNLPQIVNVEEQKKILRLQEILKLQVQNQTQYEILKILIENIHEKKSIFQLFNSLKEKIKISKDLFYQTCKEYENNRTIFFLKKFNQEKATKKIYIYNHAFFNAITYDKKFKNEFSNMIFLELNSKYEELYYLDYVDFYVKEENLAIVTIPFFNIHLMSSSLKKIIKNAKEFDIKKITIVTISNSEEINNLSIDIEVVPFYEWALR